MTTYMITAANRFFWQTLRIAADSPDEACEFFQDYLDGTENQDEEAFEYQEGLKEADNATDSEHPYEAPDREDYRYRFRADKIDEDDDEAGTERVELVESGGNG